MNTTSIIICIIASVIIAAVYFAIRQRDKKPRTPGLFESSHTHVLEYLHERWGWQPMRESNFDSLKIYAQSIEEESPSTDLRIVDKKTGTVVWRSK